jgi:hypothetical protein
LLAILPDYVGNHHTTATFEAYLQHGHFCKQAS